MKIARKLSASTFDEARKIELLTSFYDPELINVDVAKLLEPIMFDTLLFDSTYFFELSKILTMNFRAAQQYALNIQDAFRFYSEDQFIHCTEILNHYNDLLKQRDVKVLANKYGWFDTTQAQYFELTRLSDRTTITGFSILEVDSFETYQYRTSVDLTGPHIDHRAGRLYYLTSNPSSIKVTLKFDKPTTINTLLIPICEPHPKYLEAVVFSNSAGQQIYAEDDFEFFSNEYQLELIFHPITVQSIDLHFKNPPANKQTIPLGEYLFLSSLFKAVKNIHSFNTESYIVTNDGVEEERFIIPICIVAYPMLRKYKETSVIRTPLGYEGKVKAAEGYYEALHFTNEGIVGEYPDTNIAVNLVLQQKNQIDFYELPNKKGFNGTAEKFVYVNQQFKYSLTNHVPIENPRAYLRTHTQGDVHVGLLHYPAYLELNYPLKQSFVLTYSYADTTLIKNKARIDTFGNLVLRDQLSVTNLFLDVTLSRASNNPFVTPIIKYIVCGVTV